MTLSTSIGGLLLDTMISLKPLKNSKLEDFEEFKKIVSFIERSTREGECFDCKNTNKESDM